MSPLANLLKSILKMALTVAIFVTLLAGVSMAWLIAALALLGVSAYQSVRRILGGKAPLRAERPLIEGEYRVERVPDGEFHPPAV